MDALHVNRNPRVRLDRIAKVDSHHTLAEAASFTRLVLPAIIVLVQDRRDPLRLWLELGDGKGHELNTLLLLIHRLEQAILAACIKLGISLPQSADGSERSSASRRAIWRGAAPSHRRELPGGAMAASALACTVIKPPKTCAFSQQLCGICHAPARRSKERCSFLARDSVITARDTASLVARRRGAIRRNVQHVRGCHRRE